MSLWILFANGQPVRVYRTKRNALLGRISLATGVTYRVRRYTPAKTPRPAKRKR